MTAIYHITHIRNPQNILADGGLWIISCGLCNASMSAAKTATWIISGRISASCMIWMIPARMRMVCITHKRSR